jgi:hypothetical protein
MGSIGKTIGTIAGGALGSVIAPGIGTSIGAGLGGTLGGAIGGDKNPVQNVYGTSGSTGSNLPPWLQDASQDVYNKALATTQQPYKPYGGQLTANMVPNQTYAAVNAAQNIGRFDPQYAQIKGLNNDVANNPYTKTFNPTDVNTGSFANADISGYMNPYIESALKPQLNDINQDYATRQNTLNQQAAGAGSFGGSRQGILNGMLYKQQQDALDNVRSQGYNTAFNNAQNTYLTDAQRQLGAGQFNATQNANAFNTNFNVDQANTANKLKAAQSMKDLIGTQRDVTTAVNSDLLRTGAVQQGTDQAGNQAGYQEFLRQQQYPQTQAAYLTDILAKNPATHSVSPQYYQTGDNGYAGLLSAGGQALSGLGGYLTGNQQNVQGTPWQNQQNIQGTPWQNSSSSGLASGINFGTGTNGSSGFGSGFNWGY